MLWQINWRLRRRRQLQQTSRLFKGGLSWSTHFASTLYSSFLFIHWSRSTHKNRGSTVQQDQMPSMKLLQLWLSNGGGFYKIFFASPAPFHVCKPSQTISTLLYKACKPLYAIFLTNKKCSIFIPVLVLRFKKALWRSILLLLSGWEGPLLWRICKELYFPWWSLLLGQLRTWIQTTFKVPLTQE